MTAISTPDSATERTGHFPVPAARMLATVPIAFGPTFLWVFFGKRWARTSLGLRNRWLR